MQVQLQISPLMATPVASDAGTSSLPLPGQRFADALQQAARPALNPQPGQQGSAVLADAEAALALLGDEALALAVPANPQLRDLPGKSLREPGAAALDLNTLQAALMLRAQLLTQGGPGDDTALNAEALELEALAGKIANLKASPALSQDLDRQANLASLLTSLQPAAAATKPGAEAVAPLSNDALALLADKELPVLSDEELALLSDEELALLAGSQQRDINASPALLAQTAAASPVTLQQAVAQANAVNDLRSPLRQRTDINTLTGGQSTAGNSDGQLQATVNPDGQPKMTGQWQNAPAMQTMSVATAPSWSADGSLTSSNNRGTGLMSEAAAGLPGSADSRISFAQTLASSQSAGLPTASVSTPVGHAQWGQDIGQQLVRMVTQGDQRVSLHLNPQELGPLTIDLKLAEQQAQVQMLSSQAQVRTALEQSIPLLREALAEQGIQLGEASVGEQGTEQRDFAQTGQERNAGSSAALGSDSSAQADNNADPLTIDGIVDTGVNLYV